MYIQRGSLAVAISLSLSVYPARSPCQTILCPLPKMKNVSHKRNYHRNSSPTIIPTIWKFQFSYLSIYLHKTIINESVMFSRWTWVQPQPYTFPYKLQKVFQKLLVLRSIENHSKKVKSIDNTFAKIFWKKCKFPFRRTEEWMFYLGDEKIQVNLWNKIATIVWHRSKDPNLLSRNRCASKQWRSTRFLNKSPSIVSFERKNGLTS